MIKNLLLTFCGLAMLFAAPVRMSAQMEFRHLSGFGSSLRDINSTGQGVTGNSIFDFATSNLTPMDTNVLELFNINDNGDLTGAMALDFQGNMMFQPAYKLNGSWYPMGYFPGFDANANFSIGQISENGKYVAGQMSPDAATIFEAFLFNTSTGVLEKIADPANEYSAAYTVNNNGILGGWYDPQPAGTMRVPAYMTTGPVVTPMLSQLPTESTSNQVSAINNANLMVGDRNNKPFIYDLSTGTYTEFEIPDGYTSATFTSVSEQGIAVGYCQIWTFDGLVREALVYHPSLGPQPVFIAEILADNGVTITTDDGKLGTAIAISPDGNYVCGWDNAPFFFARGWAVNFKNLLTSTCYIECPNDIEIVNLSGTAVAEYELTTNCDENPNATIKFVSGLASGALFPQGTTEVVYQLVDVDSTVLNTCSFNVTIIDEYCNPSSAGNLVAAITLVQVADINNDSPEDATGDYEDFTSIIGNVTKGNTYIAKCKGNTGGEYTDYYSAFIDWNQDGYFDTTNEVYSLGTITNSTGIDDSITSGEITVPMDALVGTTTMRVIKNWDAYTTTPCGLSSSIGQIEDYKLNVGMVNIESIEHSNIRCFPNPANEILYLTNTEMIANIEIFNVLGQSALSVPNGSTFEQINVSTLTTGMYVIKIETKTGKTYSTRFTKK